MPCGRTPGRRGGGTAPTAHRRDPRPRWTARSRAPGGRPHPDAVEDEAGCGTADGDRLRLAAIVLEPPAVAVGEREVPCGSTRRRCCGGRGERCVTSARSRSGVRYALHHRAYRGSYCLTPFAPEAYVRLMLGFPASGYSRHMLKAVACALAAAAAFGVGSADASAALRSGIRGSVIKGPTSPVCREGEPCTAPAAGIVLVVARQGVTVATVTTSEAGDLPRGAEAGNVRRPLASKRDVRQRAGTDRQGAAQAVHGRELRYRYRHSLSRTSPVTAWRSRAADRTRGRCPFARLAR